MASDSTLRDTMNQGEPGRLPDIDRDVFAGEFVNAMLLAMSATESGVSVTTNVATLANTPLVLWDANATTATATGHKKVLKVSNAFLTANNPPAGSCYWDGGLKVKFNSADAATVAAFKYPKAADASVSYLQRSLGEQD
jgi:hypothetical protein